MGSMDSSSFIAWEKPEIRRPPDNLRSSNWTWTNPTKFESDHSPLSMALLMQHYYGRAWILAKKAYDEQLAAASTLEKMFLERRTVLRAEMHRKRLVMAKGLEKPRYIYPKFKNIPSKINSGLNVRPNSSKATQAAPKYVNTANP